MSQKDADDEQEFMALLGQVHHADMPEVMQALFEICNPASIIKPPMQLTKSDYASMI
jgi:hypothetical protein